MQKSFLVSFQLNNRHFSKHYCKRLTIMLIISSLCGLRFCLTSIDFPQSQFSHSDYLMHSYFVNLFSELQIKINHQIGQRNSRSQALYNLDGDFDLKYPAWSRGDILGTIR